MQNVPVFEYDEPSRDNPALVLCIIDCSKSMRDSAAYQHAVAAITSLRKHARSKTENIRLIVLGFADGIQLGYSGWCENLISFNLDSGSQTHLKLACDDAVERYNNHVEYYCKDKNPLTNILIFTDGEHSPGLDTDYPIPGSPIRKPNKWWGVTPNELILPISNLNNVLLGVIDYSGDLPQFPTPGVERMRTGKVTCASILSREILGKAYSRDKNNPPPPGQSIEEVFGLIDNLIGKLFIISSNTISNNPQVTSAFVRLGTASTFGGFTQEENNQITVVDETDFRDWVFE